MPHIALPEELSGIRGPMVFRPETAKISDKLKALLTMAGKVQLGGKNVTAEDVAIARELGATDLEIHDTVLIAAHGYSVAAAASPIAAE